MSFKLKLNFFLIKYFDNILTNWWITRRLKPSFLLSRNTSVQSIFIRFYRHNNGPILHVIRGTPITAEIHTKTRNLLVIDKGQYQPLYFDESYPPRIKAYADNTIREVGMHIFNDEGQYLDLSPRAKLKMRML